MKISEMIERIETGIDDPLLTTEDDILPLVVDALTEAAEEFCHADLATTSTVTVAAGGAGSVALPDDYSHDLYRVVNTTYNRSVNIRSNINVLEKLYDGLASPGIIRDVAVEGTDLYFQPSPTTDTEQVLTIFYYKQLADADLADQEHVPSWLPNRFHQGIVVDYCLKELFNLVEDDMSDQRVNTRVYEARHERAREKLRWYTRRNPKQRPVIERPARFF